MPHIRTSSGHVLKPGDESGANKRGVASLAEDVANTARALESAEGAHGEAVQLYYDALAREKREAKDPTPDPEPDPIPDPIPDPVPDPTVEPDKKDGDPDPVDDKGSDRESRRADLADMHWRDIRDLVKEAGGEPVKGDGSVAENIEWLLDNTE